MLKRWLTSFAWARHGLATAWREEHNFRIEAMVAVFVVVAALVLRFSFAELALVIIAVVMVLSGEIVNTAIEDLCDKVEPRQDKTIGKVKDLMAAYVLLTSLGAAILGSLVLAHHLISLT
ncbi:MAG: hypothetical protein COV10_00780 [Candidatus Vogelbacteria bacterium CG10_big_fil_rev_8_21_14_0_10_51_16]|uniref:Diacylglycerol kinase n=1 Tax=Candidatus Vogelbacteria bacterium CG10_big_fil_rev_8_21_14_0_10_51_16 TaxID=1975045 RepID=A0A2H0RFP1_9BACT|nr:MAG: hypothetical protein COV10_00780 [Candidatus Vogelbacteria bacterium CG10_big_fil_rev_8_21_14_0_10_51_16]